MVDAIRWALSAFDSLTITFANAMNAQADAHRGCKAETVDAVTPVFEYSSLIVS